MQNIVAIALTKEKVLKKKKRKKKYSDYLLNDSIVYEM